MVRVPFPYTDRTTRQRRPALVVSAGHLGRDGTLLWVAMITSTENAPWPHDVALSVSSERTDLRAPSVVRPSKLATIEASHAEPLGDVGRELLDLVLGAIGEQMGINSTAAASA